MKKTFIGILSLFFLIPLQGQIQVSARLDSTKILIGDQVQLELFIDHSREIVVENIDLSVIEKAEKLEMVSQSNLDTVNSSDNYILTQRLILTSFDSGYHWVPPIPVTYLEGGQQKTIETNNIPLSVTTIPVVSDTASIAPIKEIREEPLKLEDLIPYLIGLAGIAGLVALIVYLVRRRRNRERPAAPEIIIPAHELALDKLLKLKEGKLWQQGKIKLFQSELTRIVREYLENRFKISALESTTEETLEKVKQLDLEGDWTERLRNMFQIADLVKFAKAKPPADFHDKVLADAEEFVIQTKPQSKLETEMQEEDNN